jgi:hypothetical protein
MDSRIQNMLELTSDFNRQESSQEHRPSWNVTTRFVRTRLLVTMTLKL